MARWGGYLVQKSRGQAAIVILLGPVGVGKSTQIALLSNYFHKRKNRTVTTFIKSNHVFSYFLRAALVLLGCSEKIFYPDGTPIVCPKGRVVRRLLPLLAIFDAVSIAIKFFFEVFIPFHFGFTVLIEEGPAMTLHTYSVCYPEFFKTKPRVVRLSHILLGWVLSKAHAQIVMDTTDAELIERRKSREFRRTELPEYVISQRKWVQSINLQGTFRIETTNKSIAEVHKTIVNVLEENVN